MGKINMARVIVGGLVAGLVWNIGEYILNEPNLGEKWRAAYEALGKPPQESASTIAIFVGVTFVLGIVAVWLYAAMRPRFGPGPKTAFITGLVLWLVLSGTFWAWNQAIGLFPRDISTITLIWGLFEIPIATLIGAWLYREKPAAATSTVEARR
jgi:hypothetical protein